MTWYHEGDRFFFGWIISEGEERKRIITKILQVERLELTYCKNVNLPNEGENREGARGKREVTILPE